MIVAHLALRVERIAEYRPPEPPLIGAVNAELVRPAGPGDEEAMKQAAAEAAHRVVGPRLPWAFAAAVVTILAGSHYGFLPGLRPRR